MSSIIEISEKSLFNISTQNTKITLMTHLKNFDLFYLFSILSYGVTGSTLIAISSSITDLINIKFDLTYQNAKNYYSYILLTQILTAPFLGLYLQKRGLKAKSQLVISVLYLISTISLLILPSKSTFYLDLICVLIGISFALYSITAIPIIAITLAKKSMSLGLNLATICQCVISGIVTTVIGNLSERRTKVAYGSVLWFIVGLSFLTSIVNTVLYILSVRNESVLDYADDGIVVKNFRESRNARLEFSANK